MSIPDPPYRHEPSDKVWLWAIGGYAAFAIAVMVGVVVYFWLK